MVFLLGSTVYFLKLATAFRCLSSYFRKSVAYFFISLLLVLILTNRFYGSILHFRTLSTYFRTLTIHFCTLSTGFFTSSIHFFNPTANFCILAPDFFILSVRFYAFVPIICTSVRSILDLVEYFGVPILFF